MQRAETGVAAGGDRSCSGRRQELQRAETVNAERRQTVQKEETGGTERGDMRQDKRGADRGGD